MSDWISVKDSMPEDSLPKNTMRKMIKCHTTTDKGEVKRRLRQRWMGKMFNLQWNKGLNATPTHCMQLPNPPRKKKEIQISVSDEKLNKIATEIANEIGIKLAKEPKHICNNCRWYKPWYNLCEHPQRCVDFGGHRNKTETCEKWEDVKMTNAEKLRTLNIEELADFLIEIANTICDICECENDGCRGVCSFEDDCKKQIIRWLNSEVKDE